MDLDKNEIDFLIERFKMRLDIQELAGCYFLYTLHLPRRNTVTFSTITNLLMYLRGWEECYRNCIITIDERMETKNS